jgi:hypothetical protein
MNNDKDEAADKREWLQKKLQVFVSSPFGGMEDYRRCVMEGVVRAGHVPILLENFSFSNEEDIPVIVNALKECQVYILILGYRYGSLVSESAIKTVCSLCPGLTVPKGISYTELEYRLAKHFEEPKDSRDNGRLAIFTILFDKKHVEEQRNRDYATNAEHLSSKEKAAQDLAFWDFYERVSGEKKFGKPLSSKAHKITMATLPLEIRSALDNLDMRQLQGWIPEPKGIPPKLIPAISQNQLTQAIIGSLGRFGSLDQRLAREPELKQRACEFFWKTYGTTISQKKTNLFFESGSTIAFLADAIGAKIVSRNKASSNNVLAHLSLWLVHRGICDMFPSTTPDFEDQYGATFGEHIDNLYNERSLSSKPPEPDYRGKPLDEQEKQAIKKTLLEEASPNHWKGSTLLLGAISGIQMGENPKIKWGGEAACKEELMEFVARCRGFHVGSYKNKLFKRFMYETKLPLMVFLDESKIDCKIEVGRCHFIFDREEFTWEDFMKSYPLAFCIGCHATNIERVCKPFKKNEFEIIRDNGTYIHRAFIARNAAFKKAFAASQKP